MMRFDSLDFGSLSWPLQKRTGVFGILNVTPDSFSDGGLYDRQEAAVERGLEALREGADALDIGGESTRPGFEEVSASEEIDRIEPVIREIVAKNESALISIDTTKAQVAEAALNAGASIVNDIWGFRKDPELAAVAARSKSTCVLMRNGRGGMRDSNLITAIQKDWEKTVSIALSAGVDERRIILDPGIGFTDTREQDLELLRNLRELRSFGFPLLIGVSRKRITGQPLDLPVNDRLETSLATTVLGIAAGVDFVRVHDVQAHVRAARMADLIERQ